MKKQSAVVINSCFPVTKIVKLGNGCYKLKRESLLQGDYGAPERGTITKMSKQALARLIVTIQSTEIEFSSMLTLTYPKVYPSKGDIIKQDISFLTTWLKRNFDTENLWFLEFQERGAPHFHVMLENDAITPKMRVKVGLKWTERIVLSDWFSDYIDDQDKPEETYSKEVRKIAAVNCHETVWELIREVSGARNYVTKYAAKAYQKKPPKWFKGVGRFWGCSRAVSTKGIEIDVTDSEVRDYLREHNHTVADWEVLPKYIFNVQDETQRKEQESDGSRGNGIVCNSDATDIDTGVGVRPEASEQVAEVRG